MYDKNEVYDLQRNAERRQESLKAAAQDFIRKTFDKNVEHRPIHLTFATLTALLVEFEESESRTALGGCL